MGPSLQIEWMSENFYHLIRGIRRVESLKDILEDPGTFIAWVKEGAFVAYVVGETTALTSEPTVLCIWSSAYTTRRYEVVFHASFATSLDESKSMVDATVVSHKLCSSSDPRKGTPPS